MFANKHIGKLMPLSVATISHFANCTTGQPQAGGASQAPSDSQRQELASGVAAAVDGLVQLTLQRGNLRSSLGCDSDRFARNIEQSWFKPQAVCEPNQQSCR